MEKIGLDAKYISKGQFFKTTDSINNWDINLHLSIKYGVVEVILGAKNKVTNLIIGGPASLICESIEYERGLNSNGVVIKKPSFSNYEILEVIFIEIKSIYDDFKDELKHSSH